MDTAVVIVAAGRGRRAGFVEGASPKQYRLVGRTPVLERTLRAFHDHAKIGHIVLVIHEDDLADYQTTTAGLDTKRLSRVAGRETRQGSVAAGLEALTALSPARVLIHDGVRPFVSNDLIDRVIEALDEADAALPGLPVSDTLKRISNGMVSETLDRSDLVGAQTPQGFSFEKILAAHQSAQEAGREDFTDDAQIAQWHGLDVTLVAGETRNVKLTSGQDFELAERLIGGHSGEWRSGHGSDVHRFCPGDHMFLCGVRIAGAQALEGHSDADVGLHALTDALLGALGDGDIGSHFPPSDPQWAGASSDIFLADAGARVAQRGGYIANVDVTLICEEPKIGPHREAMRTRIGEILGIETGRVSVKATTTEGLGFTGRGEGIASHASTSIWLP